MARNRNNQLKVCSVTGLETSTTNFYKNQNHVKAVDYVKAGGKVEAITKKYNISDKQLSELKTL